MSEVCCKRCGATDHVKNGIVRGFQRYLCLSCGCNFTMTPPRGKPPAMKALALLLYAMGNVSFGSIARILGVSDVAVLNWVRDEARKLPEPSTKAEVVVVTLDEMWHFVKKRLRNCGFGEPMTLLLGEPSPGFLVAVMTPYANISSTKLASKARRSSPMIGRVMPHSGEPTLHRQRPDRPHRAGQQQHSSFSRAVPSPHEGGLQGRGNGGFVAEDLPPLPRQP